MQFQITEARLALALSAFALAATLWQAYEARRATSLQQEALSILVEPTDRSASKIIGVRCDLAPGTLDQFVVWIDLGWKITVFNSSALPVALHEFHLLGESPGGKSFAFTYGPNGREDWAKPLVLAPKDFTVQYFPAAAPASPEFMQWYVEHNGCDDEIDWASTTDRRGFNIGGWKDATSLSALVTIKTGDRNEFTKRGYASGPSP